MSSEEPSALFFCCGFRSTVVELRPNGSPITVLSRCVNTDFYLRKIRIYRLISKIDVVNNDGAQSKRLLSALRRSRVQNVWHSLENEENLPE